MCRAGVRKAMQKNYDENRHPKQECRFCGVKFYSKDERYAHERYCGPEEAPAPRKQEQLKLL